MRIFREQIQGTFMEQPVCWRRCLGARRKQAYGADDDGRKDGGGPQPLPPPWRRPQTICKRSAFSHSRQNDTLRATQHPLNMYARSAKKHPLQHVHLVNYIHAQQNNLNSAFTHSLFHEHNFVGTKICTGLTFTIHSSLVSLSHILPLLIIDHATISTHMHAHTASPVCYTK